ncbi:MAG TPA: serine/threonine protein kinase [Blastocatellia bacterium]|nr:serine/threonine protein kinase [Blastocatellia bacterium]
MPELKLENSLVDNRYEVVERLNRGSFAEIFIARDREVGGMEVVIKALNTSLQGTPDADLERTLIENFQNEAIALDAVRHPHVILRWGHGTAADLRETPFHYLVLEYMPGGDLLKLCRGRQNNALTLDEALFYFKQACEALAYAHGKGIIHRDLKPNNFLLTADHRTMKIADFGVAKISTGEDNEITRVGADIYAPPEHHPDEVFVENTTGRGRLTASADIYSLAKSFYTVICGRPPSQFKCDPITNLLADTMDESVRLRLLNVLRRATDDNPEARYATVVEFWSDLAQVVSIEEEKKMYEAFEVEEDTTIIRPRLNVSPGTLPGVPALPHFDSSLASAGLRAKFTTATLVEQLRAVQIAASDRASEDNDVLQAQPAPQPQPQPKPRPKPGDRSSKFFIELQENRPAPAVQSQVKGEPLAKVDKKEPSKDEATSVKRAKKAANKFNRKLRHKIFIGLLVFTLLGAMVSVYKYVSRQDTPLGFGAITEVEIAVDELNVRLQPSSSSNREMILGSVARGSRHHVYQQPDKNWLQIQINPSQWRTKQLGVDADRGWVFGDLDGNSPKVKVVSRKFW